MLCMSHYQVLVLLKMLTNPLLLLLWQQHQGQCCMGLGGNYLRHQRTSPTAAAAVRDLPWSAALRSALACCISKQGLLLLQPLLQLLLLQSLSCSAACRFALACFAI
jgi:hypothetical protein